MTTRRIARALLTAALASAALVTAGCGTKHEVVAEADTEGIWVDAGPLDYHVQGSRVLNVAQTPDHAYVQGLPRGSTQPSGKEVWFAIFMRIENKTDAPAQTAPDFKIEDTQGEQFSQYGLDANAN